MNFSLIIAGLFFLFEPCVSFADVIPDFIGAFLIALALKKPSDALPTFEDAKNAFSRYGICSLVCTFGIIPMISVCAGDPTMNMVFSLAVNGALCAFALYAFYKLLDGIEYVSAYKTVGKRSVSPRVALGVLYITRSALAVAPQLVYLKIERIDDITAYYPYAFYRGALTVIGFIVSLIIAIPCLVALVKYFKRLKADGDFSSKLGTLISGYIPDYNKVNKTAINGFLSFLTASVWLGLPLEVDSMPTLPFVTFAVLLLIALIKLRRTDTAEKKSLGGVIMLIAVSCVSYITNVVYADAHSLFDYGVAFFVTAIIYAVYLALCFIIGLNVLKTLYKTVNEHSGRMWDGSLGRHNAEIKNERNREKALFTVAFVVLTITLLIGIITFFMQRRKPEYRLIYLGAYFLFAIIYTVGASRLKDGVNDRYS